MLVSQTTGLAYYGNLTALISLTVSCILKMASLCKCLTDWCFFPNNFCVYKFFLLINFFLFWKSTENKLQSKYFNQQRCSFMNDSNGKRFFFKDLNDCCSNFCIKTSCYLFLIYLCGQFCYTFVFDVIFLPNRRYLNLWLIWHQIWFHTSYEHIFITVNDIWFSFIK